MGQGPSKSLLLLVLLLSSLFSLKVQAGMPAPLPSGWTKENPPRSTLPRPTSAARSGDARLQGISFFIACLFLSAWGVQRLWQVLRRDLRWLPTLGYWRSFSLVILWGLMFVIVLTMISGARELMTPGAWRKQGWTYKLTETLPTMTETHPDRRAALAQLRLALWQYAATHEGHFPTGDDPAISSELWQIPAQPGLSFTIIPDRKAEETGRLLVFEPAIDDNERLVLLTNGLIGTMTSTEIRHAIEQANSKKTQEE